MIGGTVRRIRTKGIVGGTTFRNKKPKPTAMEIFEKLPEYEKTKIIWDMDEWIKREQKRIDQGYW